MAAHLETTRVFLRAARVVAAPQSPRVTARVGDLAHWRGDAAGNEQRACRSRGAHQRRRRLYARGCYSVCKYQYRSRRCTAGSSADTIYLGAGGTYDYLDDYANSGTATPVVTTNVTIEGNNSTVSRNALAAENFNLFVVDSSGDLTLRELTLTGGNGSGPYGGAVGNIGSTLLIDDCIITGNAAFGGGGVSSFYGTTTIQDSEIYENLALIGGGVLGVGSTGLGGSTTINDSTIRDNTALITGGGVAAVFTSMTINRSTVSGNDAVVGGGIAQPYVGNQPANSYLYLNQSTVTDNYAYILGGGIANGILPFMLQSVTAPNQLPPMEHELLAKVKELRAKYGIKPGPSTSPGSSPNAAAKRIDLAKLRASRVSGDTARKARREKSGHKWFPRKGARPNETEIQSSPSAPTAPYFAIMFVNQSTVDNNTSDGSSGGIHNDAYGGLIVINSTVSGNTATTNVAGGIGNNLGYAGLFNVTVTGNTANIYGGGVAHDTGVLLLERSLISGNSAVTAGNEVAVYPGSLYIADDYNVLGHDGETFAQAFYNFIPGPADVDATMGATYATPLSGILNTTLAFNGGLTQTHALPLSSPAVDRAPNADCTAAPVDDVDQRDFPRNVDVVPPVTPNDCDVGAFELQTATAANVTGFRAVAKADKNVLKWQTTNESQIAGFNVWRKKGNAEWKMHNAQLIQAKNAGDAQGNKYAFRDKRVNAGNVYRYKIEVKYLDGHTEFTDVVKVETPADAPATR